MLGQGRRPMVPLLLRPSSSPLVALYTQGLPILPPADPQNSVRHAPVLCAFIPAVFCSWEATCPTHSPALQTAAGLSSVLSADATTQGPFLRPLSCCLGALCTGLMSSG